MGTIQQGVRQVVDNCLRIKPGERVVVITDHQTNEIGECLALRPRRLPATFSSS